MVVSCVAFGCENRQKSKNEKQESGTTISFHRFPEDEELVKKWTNAIRRDNWHPTKYSFICSQHFLLNDYVKPPGSPRPMLKRNAVPSVFKNFPSYLKDSKFHRKPPSNRSTCSNKKFIEKGTQVCLPVAFSPRKVAMNRKIKTLKQKVRRLDKKMHHLEDILTILKRKKLLNQENSEKLLEQFSGISKDIFQSELKNKTVSPCSRRYSDEVKKFALTVNFYSPKAYDYLRKVFTLPHPSSIRMWTSSVNCEPGFLSEVFQHLKLKVEQNQVFSDCCLIIDGMSIRTQPIYCKHQMKTIGKVDYGNYAFSDSEDDASEALVFMLVGIRSHWKYPVGYFLTNKCNAETQAGLVKDCLKFAADHNLRVWSVTCDGTSANISTLKLLGCNITKENTYSSMNVKFKHPSRNYLVYATLDACHMLKLARNALGEYQIFKNKDGDEIKWGYIAQLVLLQKDEGLDLANKINTNHIYWQKHKMRVKIAAQTFSSSVADAIEFLQEDMKHKYFLKASATIEFIRNIDRMFDILNSRHPFMSGFKSPIRSENIHIIESVVEKISSYLFDLQDGNNCPLHKSRRKTFIYGFVGTAKSIINIAREMFNTTPNAPLYILSYKFSQDHLELLFACIRGKGGFNNNPNALQLKQALKRILMRNAITPSQNANVASFEDISSSIFSLKSSKSRTPLHEQFEMIEHHNEEIMQLMQTLEVSLITENIIYYISGYILKSLKSSIDCQKCLETLIMPPQIQDHTYFSSPFALLVKRKNRGGLVESSYFTYKVSLISEKVFQVFKSKYAKFQCYITAMIHQVNKHENWHSFFSDDHVFKVDIVSEDDHVTQIVKIIAKKYLSIRFNAYCKRYTREVINKSLPSIRHSLNKAVIFKNI